MPKDPFRNFSTFKIDPITEIRNAGIVTNGEVFWVSSSADSDHRSRTDDLGASEVKVSLQAAVDAATSDRNDYILVIPTDSGTARRLGTALDVNEDRLHILGVGYKHGGLTYNGLTFDGFTTASPDGNDTELVYVSGAGCEIGGIKFLGTSGTAALGTITATFRVGTAASGTPHDTWLHDVAIESSVTTAALGGTAPIFEVTGDVSTGIRGLRLERCWLGNVNIDPTPIVNLVGTAGPARAEFHECVFVEDCQTAASDAFVTGGTGNIEYMLFNQCKFLNLESGTLNASVYSGAAGADTPVLFAHCSAVNVTELGSGASMYKMPAQSGTAAGIRDFALALGTSAIISV